MHDKPISGGISGAISDLLHLIVVKIPKMENFFQLIIDKQTKK